LGILAQAIWLTKSIIERERTTLKLSSLIGKVSFLVNISKMQIMIINQMKGKTFFYKCRDE
jgi:hypothetical protein